MGSSKPLHAVLSMFIQYRPSSARNINNVPDFRPPYPNTSHIEIGHRGERDTKHYVTNYGNSFVTKNRHEVPTSHPGIQAFRNKWMRSRLAKWSIAFLTIKCTISEWHQDKKNQKLDCHNCIQFAIRSTLEIAGHSIVTTFCCSLHFIASSVDGVQLAIVIIEHVSRLFDIFLHVTDVVDTSADYIIAVFLELAVVGIVLDVGITWSAHWAEFWFFDYKRSISKLEWIITIWESTRPTWVQIPIPPPSFPSFLSPFLFSSTLPPIFASSALQPTLPSALSASVRKMVQEVAYRIFLGSILCTSSGRSSYFAVTCSKDGFRLF